MPWVLLGIGGGVWSVEVAERHPAVSAHRADDAGDCSDGEALARGARRWIETTSPAQDKRAASIGFWVETGKATQYSKPTEETRHQHHQLITDATGTQIWVVVVCFGPTGHPVFRLPRSPLVV